MINKLNKLIEFFDNWYVWMLIVLVLIMVLGGFSCAIKPSPPSPPDTPATIITKIVYQTNWLYALGALSVFIGVGTFLNGYTKGLSWAGAGIALLALTLTIARWGAWITGVLAILVVVGVVIFIITAADTDGNGKIDWNDLRNLFKKK